jgi:hypothetical protein
MAADAKACGGAVGALEMAAPEALVGAAAIIGLVLKGAR